MNETCTKYTYGGEDKLNYMKSCGLWTFCEALPSGDCCDTDKCNIGARAIPLASKLLLGACALSQLVLVTFSLK